jgi:hypothetical protein
VVVDDVADVGAVVVTAVVDVAGSATAVVTGPSSELDELQPEETTTNAAHTPRTR